MPEEGEGTPEDVDGAAPAEEEAADSASLEEDGTSGEADRTSEEGDRSFGGEGTGTDTEDSEDSSAPESGNTEENAPASGSGEADDPADAADAAGAVPAEEDTADSAGEESGPGMEETPAEGGQETGTGAAPYDGEALPEQDAAEPLSADAPADSYVPAARELTYTGKPQELVDAAGIPAGALCYSLDGEIFDTAIPSGINAGEYVVYYRPAGDDAARPASLTVTIAKADVAYTAPTAIE